VNTGHSHGDRALNKSKRDDVFRIAAKRTKPDGEVDGPPQVTVARDRYPGCTVRPGEQGVSLAHLGPSTAIGAALLRSLQSGKVVTRPTQGAYAFSVFAILIRRRLLRDHSATAVTEYAERVRAEGHEPYIYEVEHGESLIRAGLNGFAPGVSLSVRQGNAMFEQLPDLVAAIDPGQLPEVVYAAELRQQRRPRRGWWQRRRSLAPWPYAALDGIEAPPATRDGRVMEAYMLQDLERGHALAGEDPEPGRSCLGPLFDLLVAGCLQDKAWLDEMARRTARRCVSPLIDQAAAARLLGGADNLGDELDPDRALTGEAMIGALVELADGAGLLPTEIRSLVRIAESEL
jgi:hypothetical protein